MKPSKITSFLNFEFVISLCGKSFTNEKKASWNRLKVSAQGLIGCVKPLILEGNIFNIISLGPKMSLLEKMKGLMPTISKWEGPYAYK